MPPAAILVLALLGCTPLRSTAETVPPEKVPPPSVVTDWEGAGGARARAVRAPAVGRDDVGEGERLPVAGGGSAAAALDRTGAPLDRTLALGDPVRGATLWAGHCARCHGPSGAGDGPDARGLPARPPDLTRTRYLARLSPEYLYRIVRDGGGAVGRDVAMPAFGRVLADPDIAALVAHVRRRIPSDE